jgi:hypothetical protein
MGRKIKSNPHSLYADEINGIIYLYKNGKLIRDNLFFSRSQRKELVKEYHNQVKNNKNADVFEISIILNI